MSDFRRLSGHNEMMFYRTFSEESLNFKPQRFCEKLQSYKPKNFEIFKNVFSSGVLHRHDSCLFERGESRGWRLAGR